MPNKPKTPHHSISVPRRAWMVSALVAKAMGTDRAKLIRTYIGWTIHLPDVPALIRPPAELVAEVLGRDVPLPASLLLQGKQAQVSVRVPQAAWTAFEKVAGRDQRDKWISDYIAWVLHVDDAIKPQRPHEDYVASLISVHLRTEIKRTVRDLVPAPPPRDPIDLFGEEEWLRIERVLNDSGWIVVPRPRDDP